MSEQAEHLAIERLEPLIGEWRMTAVFPAASGMTTSEPAGEARVVFEWLSGRRFVVQRWTVPHPAAPDGIAIIGFDPHMGTYMQHYFDSRGVARLYGMGFADGVWQLWRTSPDFSALDFSQRYTGRFSDDGSSIRGNWEISRDGSIWEHDFELTYTRCGELPR